MSHAAGPRLLVARADGRGLGRLPRRRRSTAKRRCSSSTPAARPASRRASSTPRPATTCSPRRPFEWVFDHRDDDIFWCTADCGWVTGHSYVVYGPLSAGATVLMYEGAPNCPDEGRFWESSRSTRSRIFYTAPTAIRAFIKWGDHHVDEARPVEPAAAGHRRRRDQPRSVDVVPPHDRRRALPDRRHLVADRNRRHHDEPAARRDRHQAGQLHQAAARHHSRDRRRRRRSRSARTTAAGSSSPSPGPACSAASGATTSAIKEVYWSKVPGKYLAGDNARCDDDGYYWIMGRIDDVLNVSGHRLSTIEIESALVSHPNVAEAAAVGRPDELKGEAVAVFVTLRERRAERSAARRTEASTSARKSAPWPSPTTSASPTRCPRPAAAKSCGGCCATSPPARRPSATRPRWKTTACWRNCGRKKIARMAVGHRLSAVGQTFDS